jgi:hypothetical protein
MAESLARCRNVRYRRASVPGSTDQPDAPRAGGQGGIPMLLITLYLSSLRRVPTLYSLLWSCVVWSIIDLLLWVMLLLQIRISAFSQYIPRIPAATILDASGPLIRHRGMDYA